MHCAPRESELLASLVMCKGKAAFGVEVDQESEYTVECAGLY